MSMYAIRRSYGVPAKRGMRVEYMARDGELMQGVITRSDGLRLRARLDGNKRSYVFHPTYRLHYLLNDGSRYIPPDTDKAGFEDDLP